MAQLTEEEIAARIRTETARAVGEALAAAEARRQGPDEALQAAITTATIAALAAVQREKDKTGERDTDRAATMSLAHDPAEKELAVNLWPGSPIRVPQKLVDLARLGIRIPLVWLTVEGALFLTGPGRPSLSFANKLSELAYDKDLFLPVGAFYQSLQALTKLWAFVGPKPADGGVSQAALLEELHMCIVARLTDEHWPIWRLLDWSFAKRKAGKGIGLDLSAINDDLLEEAERECGHPPGQARNFVRTRKTLLTQLVKAGTAGTVAEVGKAMENLHYYATFGPGHLPSVHQRPAVDSTAPSLMSESAAKRLRSSEGTPPFRAAPLPSSSRGSGESQQRSYPSERDQHRLPTGPANTTPGLCTTCLRIVTDHNFKTCTRPRAGPDSMVRTDNGWRKITERSPFCNRYNIGQGELCKHPCFFGHYCSVCIKPGCRAVDHLDVRMQ
ncbi:hypothetical protein V8E36_006836 [Tilletia maclaganii]